jgi:hypothetical protein
MSLTSGGETLDELERFLDGCGFRSRQRILASTLLVEVHQGGPRTRMNALRAQYAFDLYLDVWEALHPNVPVKRAKQPARRDQEERVDRSIPAPAR